MSKGKRGIGLDKPCPKCGQEVPASYVSPVQDGLCGKCTDEALKAAAPKGPGGPLPAGGSGGGAGARIAGGIMIGIAAGVILCLLLNVLSPSLWDALIGPLRRLLG